MAEWSKALDLSSSGRKSAWVRTPLQALFLDIPKSDPRGIRTPSLWIWNPTRCRCAMESFFSFKRFGATFPAGSAWLGPQRIGCKQSPFKPKEYSNLCRPSGWLTKVTSSRTDTTLDLSQKAEKVCSLYHMLYTIVRIDTNQNGAPSGNRTRG